MHLRHSLCIPAILLAFVVIGCGIDDFVKNDTYATSVTITESSRHVNGISLDNENGDVEIISHSKTVIEVFAEKYVTASTRHDARDYVDEVEVQAYLDGDLFRIQTTRPNRTPHEIGDVGVDYEIRLPSSLSVDIANTNGDVVVVGMRSDIDLATTNGDIVCADIQGEFRAQNVNGDIELQEMQGRVMANSTNGELFVEILSNAVHCDARTNNGDITIYIPENASTEGTLRTVNGDVETDFVLEYPPHTGRYELRLGSGAGELEAWTNNGDIELRSLGRISDANTRTRY